MRALDAVSGALRPDAGERAITPLGVTTAEGELEDVLDFRPHDYDEGGSHAA